MAKAMTGDEQGSSVSTYHLLAPHEARRATHRIAVLCSTTTVESRTLGLSGQYFDGLGHEARWICLYSCYVSRGYVACRRWSRACSRVADTCDTREEMPH
jgi:hypothetical protein